MRILLINPPSPEQLGVPLLGLQYLAAALLRNGCEVRVIDAAARCFEHDDDWIVTEAERFDPQLVGFSLFTRWVWHAYRLVGRFHGRFPWLIAGGAHATARPDETLQHGFDVAVVGEAEESCVALVEALQAGTPLEMVPGIRFRDPQGSVRSGLPARTVEDLDQLPFPLEAQHLFSPRWYSAGDREVVPGGLLTSRGCPAKCTFCANYVTGRRFRYRSAANVVDELKRYHDRYGINFFPCWDDALTADQRRLKTLCEHLTDQLDFPFRWNAITRANMVNPEMLRTMQRAGLVHVNFGVESGDDDILKAIKKGFTTAHVVRALQWAKEIGLRTACNFMLGFPQETPAALERTLRFMERVAPLVDTFSTLGVVVPFPATPIYEEFHEAYRFTDWWLDESYSHYSAPPPIDDFDRFYRHYIDDTNLELDFFRYSPQTRSLIHECLKFKGEHNLRHMGMFTDPVFQPEPIDSAPPLANGGIA